MTIHRFFISFMFGVSTLYLSGCDVETVDIGSDLGRRSFWPLGECRDELCYYAPSTGYYAFDMVPIQNGDASELWIMGEFGIRKWSNQLIWESVNVDGAPEGVIYHDGAARGPNNIWALSSSTAAHFDGVAWRAVSNQSELHNGQLKLLENGTPLIVDRETTKGSMRIAALIDNEFREVTSTRISSNVEFYLSHDGGSASVGAQLWVIDPFTRAEPIVWWWNGEQLNAVSLGLASSAELHMFRDGEDLRLQV